MNEHKTEFEEAIQTYIPCEMYISVYVELDQINSYLGIRLEPELIGILNHFHAYVDLIVEEKPVA